MNLKKLAREEVKGRELNCGYLKQDYKTFAYENIPEGFEIDFTFYENEEEVEFNGKVVDKRIAEFDGEDTKAFVLQNDKGEKILVALEEVDNYIRDYVIEYFDELFMIEDYIEDNLRQLEKLEKFKFLTDTKFGIEIEGGWNGRLKLDNFFKTTDNSFDILDREYNNEFVYNGCAIGDKVAKDLLENYGKLNSHQFSYTRTTGTHIHFSENGKNKPTFNQETFLKVVSFLVSIEDIILDIIPSPRVGTIDKLNGEIFSKEGGYSKTVYHRENKFLNTIEEIKYRLVNDKMNNKVMDRLMEKLEKNWYGKHTVDKNAKYNITRYYGINLHSYFHNGSLELRHFEGNFRNVIYYLDLIDKIMYLIKNEDWRTIQTLLDKLDTYNKISTKSCALLYILGVNNETLSKLLSRTNYSQLNIVRSHNLLNKIRSNITNKKAELDIPSNYRRKNIEDVTCYPENIDENADYTKRKYNILDKIKNKKGNLKKEFDEMLTEFIGQDKDEFLEYINEVSQNIEEELM